MIGFLSAWVRVVAGVAALSVITACTTLHATPATWEQSEKTVVFTAQKRLMLTGRSICVYSNGKQVMAGKGRYWSNRVVMVGEMGGKPISAECGGKGNASTCLIVLDGKQVAVLKF